MLSILLMRIFTFADAKFCAWKSEFVTLTSSAAFSLAATLCFRQSVVRLSIMFANPYKNEKVAAMLRLGCGYLAAIRYVCDNWWRQSS